MEKIIYNGLDLSPLGEFIQDWTYCHHKYEISVLSTKFRKMAITMATLVIDQTIADDCAPLEDVRNFMYTLDKMAEALDKIDELYKQGGS